MSLPIVPSREFANDVNPAKRLATEEPIGITGRSEPALAPQNIQNSCQRGDKTEKSLLEIMASVPGGKLDFEAPRMTGPLQPADFA